jgi:hypothetical protein
MINTYKKIDDKDEILDFSSGMINVFAGTEENWHLQIIEKYIKINLTSKIATLEPLKNKHEINQIRPSNIYFVDFSDC